MAEYRRYVEIPKFLCIRVRRGHDISRRCAGNQNLVVYPLFNNQPYTVRPDGDAAMANDDGRLSARRRSDKDRRSGVDTRSDEERRLIGERRLNKERRSGSHRRSSDSLSAGGKSKD
jgi:hypothetical protein